MFRNIHIHRNAACLFLFAVLLSGCFGEVIIENDDLVYEGNAKSIFDANTSPLKLHVPALKDVRESKENTIGKQAGLRMLIPYYEEYKVEGHPPLITHRFLSEKLRAMGIELVNSEKNAQAVLKGSLKEFSRSGWGATVAWGNSAKVVVDLELYSKGEFQPIWKETIYGNGDDLEGGLASTAENLGENPDFKSAAISITKDPVVLARGILDTPQESVENTNVDSIAPTIDIISHTAMRGIRIVEESRTTLVRGRALDSSEITSVTVNGKPVTLSNDNSFSTQVPLEVGSNTVWVAAVDKFNNIQRKSFTVERLSAKGESKKDESLPFGKYTALVIGNNNYQHLPNLRTPHNDAREIGKVLNEQYGFHVELLLDAGRDEFMDKLNELRGRVGENDNLLIYYAGHGYYDKVAQKAYWQPVDAELDSDSKWIIVDSITSNIKRASSKHILIVADSCYSGTLTRGSMADLTTKNTMHERYIQKIFDKTSRTLMASGGNEPVADGGGGDHSVFASVFLKALKSADQKFFTAEDLFFNYIKEPVVGQAAQTPEYSTIRNSGHDGGDFVFYNWKNKESSSALNMPSKDHNPAPSFSISENIEF
ncbi:MAG: caspase family protein [Nitrospinales bacterium]